MTTTTAPIRSLLLAFALVFPFLASFASPARGERAPTKPAEPTSTSGLLFELGSKTATSTATKSTRTIASYRVVPNPELFTMRANAETLTLDLPHGARFPVSKVSGANRDGGDFTWHGRFADDRGIPGDVVLTVHDGDLAGLIYAPSGTYRLGVDDAGAAILEELGASDKKGCSVDGSDAVPGLPELDSTDRSKPSTTIPRKNGTITIDVLLVYTISARNGLGSGYEAQLANAIDVGNVAFANSGSNVRFNLVETRQTSYSESGSLATDLDWLVDNSQIGGWRDLDRADLVGMVLESDNSCGLGRVMRTASHRFAASAFQVTDWSCIPGLTLIHEFGHNLGLEHNPENSSATPSQAVYPYAFGHWVDDLLNGFRTIMSYSEPCTFCPRKPYFSNPSVSYGPFPTGTSSRDNRHVLDVGSAGEGTGRIASIFRNGPGDDDRYEDNDSLATAIFHAGSERTWLSELEGEGIQKDEDWYEIYVDDSVRRVFIDLRFTHDDGDIDVALYDRFGTQIASSISTTSDERINHVVPFAGTYYIRVYYGNGGNSYDMYWDDLPLQPDLTIPRGGPTQTLYLPGRDMVLDAFVHNAGPLDADASTVRFYIVADYPTVYTNGTEFASIAVGAVSAEGTRQARQIAFGGVPTTPGTYWIGACVDPVANENPTNNQCLTQVEIEVSGSDQRPTEPEVGNPRPVADGTLSIAALIGNYGEFGSGTLTVRYLLSTNDSISLFDTELGNIEVQSLGPLDTARPRLTVPLTGVAPGNYWVGVCVDEVINEIDTTNQCSEGVPIQVSIAPFFSDGFESGDLAGWASGR